MKLIQQIAIKPSGHFDTIAAAAIASTLALAHGDLSDARWSQWLSGAFTKSVRQAKTGAAFERVRTIDPSSREFTVGDATAIAFAPAPFDEMPAELKRFRVTGIDADRSAFESRVESASTVVVPVVEVNRGVMMSTGKTAAQVAHALNAWFLAQTIEVASSWRDSPCLAVRYGAFSPAQSSEEGSKSIQIVDNGLTEIAPGTATARVYLE